MRKEMIIMTNYKFKGHESAQCYVHEVNNDNKYLVSYSTKVAEIRDGWMMVNGLYSRTTIKHIGWFMRSLGFDYQLAKALCEKHLMMNIHTGEIEMR